MYHRYGLNENPFQWADALDQPDHFLTVEGFGEQRPIIDNFKRGKLKKTHFFLIHGISGTGRTSVSNYVAHRYADGLTPLKVNYGVNDEAHRDTFHKWMEKFSLAADLANIPEIPKYFKEIEDRASATEAKYTKFLYQSLQELAVKKRPLVAVFEDVRNAELFELVRTIFDPDLDPALPDFPLVIFTCSDEAISNRFGNLNPKPVGPNEPIKLRALNGQDVLNFIDQRWRRASNHPEHPFDTASIVRVFNDQQYPLKRAIHALNSIFEEKVQNLPAGGDWPTDERLKIRADEIALSLIGFISKTPI